MRTIKRILGVFLFALTLVLVAPSILPVNGNVYTVEAATKINKKKVTLIKGQTTTLKISGTKKKVKWSSNKKSIASVSSKGKVTAKKKGEATITAKIGKKKYTCKVFVQDPKLNKSNLVLYTGESYDLQLLETDKKVTWKSSDDSVVSVDKNGRIHALDSGNAIISAMVLNKKYTCNVIIKEKSVNPQDEFLSKIEKRFIVDSFYSSNWNNVLIGVFRNNTGYDLEMTVKVEFNNEEDWSNDVKTNTFFKNHSEIVMIFDSFAYYGDFKSYDINYEIKKTTEISKNCYNDAQIKEEKDNYGRLVVFPAIGSEFYGDIDVVYLDSSGNIIDYYSDECIHLYEKFTLDLPVDRKLNNVNYSSYIASYSYYENN